MKGIVPLLVLGLVLAPGWGKPANEQKRDDIAEEAPASVQIPKEWPRWLKINQNRNLNQACNHQMDYRTNGM